MIVHFDESQSTEISTNILNIPYYAGRTVLRMWVAFGFSLLFTFAVGYVAAKNRIARAIILPALDILQSVPVLGFLSITVTGFMALFPGSLLGVECASIFAIFTGQVWNMTFGFYHSMVTIPNDLREAATNFRHYDDYMFYYQTMEFENELPSFEGFFIKAHYNSDLVFAGYHSKQDFLKDFEQKSVISNAYKEIEMFYNRVFRTMEDTPQP
jgi:hypothetical protein